MSGQTITGWIVVTAPAKVQKFQQITTEVFEALLEVGCNCTSKGTKISANHNFSGFLSDSHTVVTAPAKVQKFQQITTVRQYIPFSKGCNCTSKGTKISANHNRTAPLKVPTFVVTAPAKVQKFQQITTLSCYLSRCFLL